MTSSAYNKFYCSQKFTWLSVDLEKKQSYSCCAAIPSRVDVQWLHQHPGGIFNTPLLHKEREAMLADQPVSSCETSCWQPERNQVPSKRILDQSYVKTHTDIQAEPEVLNIILGSTCNLTCSYCCKNYSSAWLRDIVDHGPYLEHQRYQLAPIDRVLFKISQPELKNTKDFNFLLNELATFKNLPQVRISGGEPFLYNNLVDVVEKIGHAQSISINTGLGVDNSRLRKLLERLQQFDNVEIKISAETVGSLYEFNRYGNTWENFIENVNTVREMNFSIAFMSVISNLTIHGLLDFDQQFGQYPGLYEMCSEPDFLAVNVLDRESKSQLCDQLANSTISIRESLIQALQQPCQPAQQADLARYITEFASRRQLNLDIFPTSMLKWLDITQG